MRPQNITRSATAAGSAVLAGAAALAAEKPKVDDDAVNKAFETLKTYDWGADRNLLNPIDEAIIATQGDAAARLGLEKLLIVSLKGDSSRSAKDYICRALKTMGTAESVPALAALLPDADLSHIARFALERIPVPEAAAAMRDSLAKVPAALKVGVIGSLGSRRDASSASALTGLLGDADKTVACTAAGALGSIGTPEAGTALGKAANKAPDGVRAAVAAAGLVCGEQLLADGKRAQAITVYKSLDSDGQAKHVRLAAKRGLLMAAGS